MKKNELILNGTLLRVLSIKEDKVLVVDCVNKRMPFFASPDALGHTLTSDMNKLLELTKTSARTLDSLDLTQRKKMNERYSLISAVLPFIDDEILRKEMIKRVSEKFNVSKQTIRKYLINFLIYQDIVYLAPDYKIKERALTPTEVTFRYYLNQYFYTSKKMSLKTVFIIMLREKFMDENGNLKIDCPKFHSFKNFYYKTRTLTNEICSREGVVQYRKNYRVHLGDYYSYFNQIGIAQIDSTILDIYVTENGLAQRPVLSACIDSYTQLCLGYYLGFDRGTSGVIQLFKNVVEDKKEWANKYGIDLEDKMNINSVIPSVVLSDNGRDYVSTNLSQLTDLGVRMISLDPYRPDEKPMVERFMGIIQKYWKPYLKSMGVVEPNLNERGAPNYLKTASITLKTLDEIIARCVVHYNCSRKIESFPYTFEMMNENIKPYSIDLFNYFYKIDPNKMISIKDKKILNLTLLPRTTAKFSREGLILSKKLRYRCMDGGYRQEYLKGEEAIVAYNKDDLTIIYHVFKKSYIPFEIIEEKYKGLSLEEIEGLTNAKKHYLNEVESTCLKSQVRFSKDVQSIVDSQLINKRGKKYE